MIFICFCLLLLFLDEAGGAGANLITEVICVKKPCQVKRGGLLVMRYYWDNVGGNIAPVYTFTLWRRPTSGGGANGLQPGSWMFTSNLGSGFGVVFGESKYFVANMPTSIRDGELLFQFVISAALTLTGEIDVPTNQTDSLFLMNIIAPGKDLLIYFRIASSRLINILQQ